MTTTRHTNYTSALDQLIDEHDCLTRKQVEDRIGTGEPHWAYRKQTDEQEN